MFRTRHSFLATFAMRARTWAIPAALGLALTASVTEAQTVDTPDPQNLLVIEIGYDYDADRADATPGSTGRVVIELLPDLAPQHVERIRTLADQGFYDGAPFHRVIDGFMAQTGDPRNQNGTGGSDLPDLPAEFSAAPFERGVVGMARAQNPNSANSQFFIMFDRYASLDGQYTVFGRVIEGIENIDRIKRGERSRNGEVTGPRDRMVTVRTQAALNG